MSALLAAAPTVKIRRLHARDDGADAAEPAVVVEQPHSTVGRLVDRLPCSSQSLALRRLLTD